MYSIGEMARRSGVKVPTIRYYEQIGLLEAPERSAGNQRRYTKAQLERLSFIRHARDLGLSLDAIGDLARLSEQPDMACDDAHAIAGAHLEAIELRIDKLQRLRRELKRINTTCQSDHIGECYVIQSLMDHGLCDDEH